MKVTFAKSLFAAAALALSVGAAHAAGTTIGTQLIIQEGAITGALPNAGIVPGTATAGIAVNQLSGQYDELFTALTSTTNAQGTTTGNFASDAIFNAGGWFLNGKAALTQLNNASAAGYGLYVKFASTGTYSITSAGVLTINTNSAQLQVFADPNQDSVYGLASTATGNVNNLVLATAGTAADDQLLGSASILTAAAGSAQPGLANGNFELVFGDFALANPSGLAYFVAPRPFTLNLDLNGNFQNFNPLTASTIALTNNSANAFFFPVPEPSALALAGIALFGAAMVTRRKNRKS